MKKYIVTSLSATLLMSAIFPMTALAYNGNAAASYADQWWYNYNSNYPVFSEDCTNFVSQALHAGGFSFVGDDGNSNDNDYHWWINGPYYNPPFYYPTWIYTRSWSVADDLRTFLILDIPGGSLEWEGPCDTQSTPGTSYDSNGDVVFYDWNSDGIWDHAAIRVARGYDVNYSNLYGDLVDEHTTNRYHVLWTLYPYNTRYATTTIDFFHVWSNNP